MYLESLLNNRPKKVWCAEITAQGFNFIIKKNLYNYFLESDRFKENYSSLTKIPRNVIGDIVILYITLPLINFPNLKRSKLNHKKLSECMDQIILLLELLNQEFEDNLDEEIYFGNDLQLVTINVGHYERHTQSSILHISANFSEEARNLLCKPNIINSDFPNLEEIIYERYLRLSENRKSNYDTEMRRLKKFGGEVYSVHVGTSSGVPHFKVPGNCACLSAAPDQFGFDGNIRSHNIDHTLQAVTMFTALICFWNDVLNPLYFDSLKK